MSIVLYGLDHSPPCMAVLVTAKIIGVKFEFKKIDLSKGEHLTESFQKLNPAHSVPALDDGGLHIWESRAIISYLVDEYGDDANLYPKELKQRARVDNMLYFDAASLYPSFAKYFYPHFMEKKPYDPAAEDQVKGRLSILDQILSQESFVAGGTKPSLADISIRCSLFTPIACGYTYEPYPNLLKWIERFEAAVPSFNEYTAEGAKELGSFFQGLIA